MTDKELAKQAEAHLRRTTVSYPDFVKRVAAGRYKPADGSGTEWGKAFTALNQIGAVVEPPPTDPPPTPPGGKLAFAPPTLTNPMMVTIDNAPGRTINGNGGDIQVNPGFHRSVPFGQNATITFTNYRHLIVRGGRHTLNAGPTDDGNNRTGFAFSNSTGHTFVEGVLWDGAPLRSFVVGGSGTPFGTLTVQNCRVEGTRDNRRVIGGNFQHSDIMMWWSRGPGVFQLDKCTFEYDNTGFAFYNGTTEADQGPARFDARRVNLRHSPPGNWGNVFLHIVDYSTISTATDCWTTTDGSEYIGGQPKPLQDAIGGVVNYPTDTTLRYHPYRITRPSTGAVLNITTAAEHVNPGSLNQMGRQQGDYIERQHPSFAGERWAFGVPPAGDFCPAGVAGTAYVSPGYT